MSDVAIFWDYENCSPPSNSPGLGFDIVNNIHRIARLFGSVTTFRAYLDLSAQSPKSVLLRSELQSSGVSIIDCPHNGKKDVVDKMVLVDMLAFAIDHPPPATVILITGDRDYAYAVSVLKLRTYHLILVVPSPQSSPSLESQASLVIDWSAAILRSRTDISAQAVRQPYLDLDPNLVARILGEIPDDSHTPLYLTSLAPHSSSRLRRVSARDLLGSSRHSSSVDSSSRADDSSPDAPPIPRTPSRPRLPSVSMGSTRAHSTTFAAQSPTPPPLAPSRGLNCLAAPFVMSRFEPDTEVDCATYSPSRCETPSRVPVSSPEPMFLGIIDDDDDNDEDEDDDESAHSAASTPASSDSDNSAPDFMSVLSSVDTSPRSTTDTDGSDQRRQNWIKFRPLIYLLLAARENGFVRPSRSIIATSLLQTDKYVYQHAGVTRFKDYTALAECAGVVELGGRDGDAWIALHPNWLGADTDIGPADDAIAMTSARASSPPSVLAASSQSRELPILAWAPGVIQDDTALNWAPRVVPPQFQPLIDTIVRARAEGTHKPLRSIVGQQLSPDVYTHAGVSGFKEYVHQASEALLVQCGGVGGHAWIRLHPGLRT